MNTTFLIICILVGGFSVLEGLFLYSEFKGDKDLTKISNFGKLLTVVGGIVAILFIIILIVNEIAL